MRWSGKLPLHVMTSGYCTQFHKLGPAVYFSQWKWQFHYRKHLKLQPAGHRKEKKLNRSRYKGNPGDDILKVLQSPWINIFWVKGTCKLVMYRASHSFHNYILWLALGLISLFLAPWSHNHMRTQTNQALLLGIRKIYLCLWFCKPQSYLSVQENPDVQIVASLGQI